MKFRFLLVLVSAFVIVAGMSSCVREYTCQCVIKYSGQPGLPDSTIHEYTVRDTKKKAKSVCEANSGTYENGSIKTVEDCHLY